jgi:hypothetical protein
MLARKNHAKAEATSSLRTRKAVKQAMRACLQAGFKVMNQNKLLRNSSLQKSAEFAGVAGEFRCHSLHRSQISQNL